MMKTKIMSVVALVSFTLSMTAVVGTLGLLFLSLTKRSLNSKKSKNLTHY